MKTALQHYLGACVRRAIRREKPRIKVVAGSVGKSSTKEAVGVALGAYENGSGIRVSAKNYNNELGVPLTILNRPAPGKSPLAWAGLLWQATLVGSRLKKVGVHTFVLEYGTDRPGDLEYLVSLAPPDLAVLTAIGAEHTEFFGSVDKVAEEELSVVRSLRKGGVAVLNADDSRVMEGKRMTEASIVTFGESPESEVRLLSSHLVVDEQQPEDAGLEVKITAIGKTVEFRLKGVFGKPHAMAAAAAIAVAFAADEDVHEAAERLRKYSGLPGRTRLIAGIKRTMLLDDSYNSSPLAALSAVRDLSAYPVAEGAKRIAAIGDMLELGALAEEAHAELGREIAKSGIDMLVVCGTLAHTVADAARQAGMPEESVFIFGRSPEAGLFIQEKMRQGDAVLIKGSQGARMEKITKELMAHPEHAADLLVRQTSEWV